MYMLGGLGTAGIVTIYLPICDGFGRQVCFGMAEELLRFSISDWCEERYPENWLDGIGTRTDKDKRFEVQYNPHIFAMKVEFSVDLRILTLVPTLWVLTADKNLFFAFLPFVNL
jgi:hypothetical protein